MSQTYSYVLCRLHSQYLKKVTQGQVEITLNHFLKIIFYWLCYYSCPNFPPLPPSTQHPPILHAILTTLFMSMGHAYKFFGYSISILYFTSPWLFCNYLFVLLNPLTSSPIRTPYPWFHLCSTCLLSLIFRFSCWLLGQNCSRNQTDAAS